MKGHRLFILSALALAAACESPKAPTALTELTPPTDPSQIISDGAHCSTLGIVCNPDFFFLPPMVPLPLHNPNFELGKFNNTLRPSLKIDICQLQSTPANTQGLPTANTQCDGAAIKTFGPGSVQLVNLPLRQNGWWTLFGLPPDGFYYVLWDTRQSRLDVNKYYRIKVLIAGSPDVVLGVADVDPMSSLFQWKYTLTGEVIQLINGFFLPIPFRVEHGGGPALCGGATICASATVTNHTPDRSDQVVPVQGNNGPIAGVVLPDGWLPAPETGGPQTVVVTISAVNTGVNDVVAGAQANPCHAGLVLEQFNGCFKFTTTPALAGLGLRGHQFAKEVTVVTCYVLHDKPDPREPWVQLWSSGPNEQAHSLNGARDVQVLTAPTEHACGTNFPTVIGSNARSNALTQLASDGWRKLKGGLGRVFGVETAYAVDLGLGGLTLDFSNVSPVLTAQMDSISPTDLGVQPPGGGLILAARIVGTVVHQGGLPTTGIGTIAPTFGLPMTFTVETENGGTLLPHLAEPVTATPTLVTEITNPNRMNADDQASDAWAAVTWWLPNEPGTYRIKAKSPKAMGELIFTATVPSELPNPFLTFSGTEFYPVGDVNYVKYNLAVANYQAYPAAMFAAAPQLAPCGYNANASRTWVNIYDASNNSYIYGFCALGSPSDLLTIWFSEPSGTLPPTQVYITMLDRLTNVTYTSNSVHPIPPSP